jgi:hypothetical protein
MACHGDVGFDADGVPDGFRPRVVTVRVSMRETSNQSALTALNEETPSTIDALAGDQARHPR